MAGYSLVPPNDEWAVFYDTAARRPGWLRALLDFLAQDLAVTPRVDALPLPAGEGDLPRYLRMVPGTDLAVEFRVSDLMSAVLLDRVVELPPPAN